LAGGGGFHFFGHCSNGDWFALPKALCDMSLHHAFFQNHISSTVFGGDVEIFELFSFIKNRDSETLMLAAQERFQDIRGCTAKYFIMISMRHALGLSQCSSPNCKVHVVLYHC
jgi:hypothetical protein